MLEHKPRPRPLERHQRAGHRQCRIGGAQILAAEADVGDHRVEQYKLPDPMVTNVCFGGKDLRTAYATLSMTGTLVSFEWPRPGLALEPAR